jgi:diguanylate cyclase (GGDEF)-like protein
MPLARSTTLPSGHTTPDSPAGVARLWLLAAAVLITPTVVGFEALRGRAVPAPLIVLGTTAAVVLVTLRVTRIVRELQASRNALAHETTHDPLTGIANRTLFSRRLTDVLTEGRRCSVVLIDLDEFKSVNDELGHLVGDALLVEAARRLTSAVRTDDLVARFAGDEFAVLLPDTSPESARQVTARAADLLNADVPVAGHRVPLRASVGLAHWDAASCNRTVERRGVDEADHLLAAADEAMYRAKRQRARHLVLVHALAPAAEPADHRSPRDIAEPAPERRRHAGRRPWDASVAT